MKKKSKLIKVLFERDDGEVKYLEGKDAQRWEDEVNSIVAHGFAHGLKLDVGELKWKVEHKEKGS